MGVANDRSIAWGIARVLAGQGAELAFTYQGDAFGRRAIPLAESVGSEIIVSCDVEDLDSVDKVFDAIRDKWGKLDFVVHALAFSDRNELKGRYADTSRENFTHTMVYFVLFVHGNCQTGRGLDDRWRQPPDVDLWRFDAGRALLQRHGCRQGRAGGKRALSRRRPRASGGPRECAFSPGPMRTLAGAGISDARLLFNYQKEHGPMKSTPTLDQVGGSALYLLSDLSGAVTGEVHFADCGYYITAMPTLEALKTYGWRRRGRTVESGCRGPLSRQGPAASGCRGQEPQ